MGEQEKHVNLIGIIKHKGEIRIPLGGFVAEGADSRFQVQPLALFWVK